MGDHLIVFYSAVRALPGYDRHETPSILMAGNSLAQNSEHGRAVTAQLTRRHDTLEEAIDAGMFGLSAADVTRGVRRNARAACEDYFYERLGLAPDYELRRPTEVAPPLELLEEPMVKPLEELVEYIVDGSYEELREASNGLLDMEDMRRRVEDDCPEALVLPPREVYRVEAIAKSDEPEDESWAFFLDLWTEDGPARLHIEGLLEQTPGGRYAAILADILP